MQETRSAARLLKTARIGLATLAALGVGSAAMAQTVVTGHYDNQSYDGLDVQHGNHEVPADSGGQPAATFNGNKYFGLTTFDDTLAVYGGQFDSNGASGIYVENTTATLTGGQFNDNGQDGIQFTVAGSSATAATVSGVTAIGSVAGLSAEDGSTVTVLSGQFSGNTDYGIDSFAGSSVAVYGGTFGGNGLYDFQAFGVAGTPVTTLDLYGRFLDPVTGLPLASGSSLGLTGTGTFVGTLANNTASASYTYENESAVITLHEVAAPEPSQVAGLALGVLGLGGLALRARKKTVA